MGSILDVAAAPAVKGNSGPTTFRALRETLTDDGSQLQLVERVGDAERFVLVTRETHPSVALVERVNARNIRRHEIDALLKDLDEIIGNADADSDDLAPEVQNALAERETLSVERKGLPKIDAMRCAPVARALLLYGEQDDE